MRMPTKGYAQPSDTRARLFLSTTISKQHIAQCMGVTPIPSEHRFTNVVIGDPVMLRVLRARERREQYIGTALGGATYEFLNAEDGWYGEIPGFQGVWANAPTPEECRRELKSVL